MDSFIGLHPATNPLSLQSGSDGVEFRVFIEPEDPIATGVVSPQRYAYFNGPIGFVSQGDTVHVAFGANGNYISDYFTIDFTIVRDVEREDTVGTFGRDFLSKQNEEFGWNYLWNEPTDWSASASGLQNSSPIGDPSNYQSLDLAGVVWTADGDTNGSNSVPDYYLRVTPTGGHPGLASSNPLVEDRYSIVAYTVEHSGLYSTQESLVEVNQQSVDGIEILVHIGDELPLVQSVVDGGDKFIFDASLGYIQKGETIYIAFGANGNHFFDSFETDFSIVRYLPREKPNLELLNETRSVVSANESFYGQLGAIPDDHVDDTQAIQNAIAIALQTGATELRFNPGIYDVDSDRDAFLQPYFRLDGVNDLVIDGHGSTFVLSNPTRPFLNTRNSQNVIIKDLKIDYATIVPGNGDEGDLFKPLTFTQGYIKSVAPDLKSFTVNINLLGFEAPNESFVVGNGAEAWGYAIDPQVDGRLKANTPWHYATLGVEPGAEQGDFVIQTYSAKGLEVGDRYILQRRFNRALFGFYNNSRDISLVKVTAYSAPSAFVGTSHSERINVIDSSVEIRPDDWPTVTNTQRWKSINGDGVHVQSSRTGVWVENSSFNGLGDDVMNLYTRPMTILDSSSANQFTLATILQDRLTNNVVNTIRVDDILTFFDPVRGKVLYEARVVDVEFETRVVDGKSLRVQRVALDQVVEGTLLGTSDDIDEYRNETVVFNRSLANGSVVQDSTLSNPRRYGNVLMSDNFHLVDNVYEGLSDEAIAAHNEPAWPLGLFTSDILVQGNEFVDNGFSRSYHNEELHTGVVAFKGACLIPRSVVIIGDERNGLVDSNETFHENVEIKDNVFYDWNKSSISIRNASGVNVVGNSIVTGPRTPNDLLQPIEVLYSTNVQVASNAYVGGADAVDVSNVGEATEVNTQAVSENDLVAWFKLDTAESLKDNAGNGTQISSSQVATGDGKFAGGLRFSGESSALIHLPSESTKLRTVSLWFNADEIDLASPQLIYSEGSLSRGLNIHLKDGRLYVGAWVLGSFETFLDVAVESETWNHVSLVFDGQAREVRGYLNGRKFDAGFATSIPSHSDPARLGAGSNLDTQIAKVGTNDPVAVHGLRGFIDDVRIYERPLGDDEIRSLALAW